MATRIQIAKPDIVKTFAEGPRVLHAHEVASIFHQHRDFWRLTKNTSVRNFIQFLQEKTELRPVRYAFPTREISGYTWGEVPLFEALLGLVSGSYYSHYTALTLHGLTEQTPKTIYLSHERPSNSTTAPSGPFEQANIDAAFQRPPRISKNEVELPQEGLRLVLLEGTYQAGAGITHGEVNMGGEQALRLRYTGLERTMIDAAVRPFYAGGVFEVAKAFENAIDRLSVNAMAAMLSKMSYGYPYHQVIGYYLERAGYKASLVDLFHRQPMERDFYLAHDMGRASFSRRWRLYVPEGF